MTDPSLLLKSALIGASIAAPVGPMSLLCMRRTLARGWQNGLAIGGGIALGDGVFDSQINLPVQRFRKPVVQPQ